MSVLKKQKITVNEIDTKTLTESQKLLAIENELCIKLENLKFCSPVMYVYNPLTYAKILHEAFVKKYFEHSTKKILFLGMNPGPWGMCQTGIFFGERDYVKDWFQITGLIDKPFNEHPKKKVLGLNCNRSERSGKKFWSFFKHLCKTPENFFKHSFVYNFCPLAFLDVSGKNITPPEIKDKITKNQLTDICNEAFISIINQFNFEVVIPVGTFTERKAIATLKSNGVTSVEVCKIPHPSPRNAKNLSNWEQTTFAILQRHNLLKYFTEDSRLGSTSFIVNHNDSE